MLLRICLVLAILAGAGVIAVSHFKVRPHIQGIIQQREDNAAARDREKKRATKAETDLTNTKITLESTKTKLSETEGQLQTANTKASDQEKRATGLQQNLEKTKVALTAADQELSAWKALGVPVEQVSAVITAEKNLRQANEVLETEKTILQRVVTRLSTQIATLVGTNEVEVPLPAGLKGKILVVDPKWDFVVLDIGETQGVVQNGVMMVSRDSKLVAKVKIMSVQQNRSIANIIPNWKLSEVMEGDSVLY